MSRKTSKVRILQICGETVIADRTAKTNNICNFFRRTDGREPDDLKVVALTDRKDGKSFAEIIEETDFESADLPIIL